MKIIKSFAVAVLALVLSMTFCGCSCSSRQDINSVTDNQPVTFNDSPLFAFELVSTIYITPQQGRAVYFYVFRDTTTDVLYLHNRIGDGGGITAMLDPENGLPLTYERYVSIYRGDAEMLQE